MGAGGRPARRHLLGVEFGRRDGRMWATRHRRDRELAALADGSLSPRRRRAVEAEVAASPRLQAQLREQEEALTAIRARDERAPAHLRETIAAGPVRARRRRGFALAAATGVAVVTALGLMVTGSEPPPATLAAAAALGAGPAKSPRPVSEPRERMLPGVAVEGVRYPDWRHEYGWRAHGSRADR